MPDVSIFTTWSYERFNGQEYCIKFSVFCLYFTHRSDFQHFIRFVEHSKTSKQTHLLHINCSITDLLLFGRPKKQHVGTKSSDLST